MALSVALSLARSFGGEHSIELLFSLTSGFDPSAKRLVETECSRVGVKLLFLNAARYGSFGTAKVRGKSYAVFRHLVEFGNYDVVHFVDEGWLAFYTLCARSQGVAFANTVFFLQPTGSAKWRNVTHARLPSGAEQLHQDFMEREAVARTDYLLCPSKHLLDWMSAQGWKLPAGNRTRVLPILPGCTEFDNDEALQAPAAEPIDELIVLTSRHTGEGLSKALKAIDMLHEQLADSDIKVTFMGPFQIEESRHSGLDIVDAGRGWTLPIAIAPAGRPDVFRRYLHDAKNALVISPDAQPFASGPLLEHVLRGRPVIIAGDGAAECIDPNVRGAFICLGTKDGLTKKLSEALSGGLPTVSPAHRPRDLRNEWSELYRKARRYGKSLDPDRDWPRVSVCITHYRRIHKLKDAINSILRQTYANIELIVVDDASSDPQVDAEFAQMKPFFQRNGIKLVQREQNGYLGAARNSGAAAATGEYLCFLDDDDIALPTMIERMVVAALSRKAGIVSCLQVNMPASRRGEAWPLPQTFDSKVSFFPIGGPLSLTLDDYSMANASSLFSRRAFLRLGGYTELADVGAEDHEIFTRALLLGMSIEICPFVGYLYETGSSSMLTQNNPARNMARVVNALKLNTKSGDWSDFFELAAGRTARDRAIARRKWLIRNSPNLPTLQALFAATAPEARLDQLILYAAQTGAANVCDALKLAHSAQSGINHSQPLRPIKKRAPAPAPRPKRTQSLASRLKYIRDRDLPPDSALISDLRSALAQALPVAQYRRLALLADWKKPNDAFAEVLEETAFLLALFGKDWAAAASRLRLAEQADEAAYLKKNADVANAVSTGAFESGLQHFVLWGAREGRPGFARLLRMGEALQHVAGKKLALDELTEFADQNASMAAQFRKQRGRRS
jgi:glycosyltransferase involved in cell wall biosynthesis